MKQLFLWSLFFLWCCPLSFSQLSGQIVDAESGEVLIAATVQNLSNNGGAITDENGQYQLEGNVGDSLQISYIGYRTKIVSAENDMVIELSTDEQALDEVVVIGYGEAQSRDLTSSITTVSGEEVSETPSGQAMQSMQGKVAGLQVVSAGNPGDQPTVRLRGLGSYGSNDAGPLYVVDGMFFDNIDFINNSDIESISVLKDASAAAIYGVRAANGVVIIETKSGDLEQPTEVTVNSYYGVQQATDVLKMANAEQYVQMVSELDPQTSPDYQYVLNAMQQYGRSRLNPNVPAVNTDWYDEIMRTAPIQDHNISITGGGSKAGYSLGGSFFDQDGILDMENSYQRYNFRAKVDFQAYDWLKVGGNAIMSNAEKFGQESSAWTRAYYSVPTIGVFDNGANGSFPDNYSSAQNFGYRGGQNPFHVMDYIQNKLKIKKSLTNFYVEIDILPETLTFKSQYNQNVSSLDNRRIEFPYFYSDNAQRDDPAIRRRWNNFDNKIWDNTLTYKTSFAKNDLTILAGNSIRNEQFTELRAAAENIPINEERSWYIDRAGEGDIIEDGVTDNGGKQLGESYFSRVSYKYDNKYIIYGTFRADGSSKYQEKWGYFPSVGAAWVASDEEFFSSKHIDFLKIRGGWGQLGNDRIPGSVGQTTLNPATTVFDNARYSGYNPAIAYDSLVWEVVEERNIGVTFDAFDNQLSGDIDYFIRDTKNARIPVPVPFVGETVNRPVGEIRNQGFEFSGNWFDNINDKLSYSVGGNFSTLKNEVLSLSGQEYLNAGSAEFRQRSYVGEPLFAFFGLQTNGIYQNQSEIDNDPVAVENNLEPGDYRFVDQDGDGDIDGDDRTILGSFLPDFTYGFNLNVSYENFAINSNFYGQAGNQILNRKRGQYIFTNDTNIDAELATNLWRGEGTSNKYPSADGLRKGWNQQMSTYYIEDGDFFRIQNVNLSYTIENNQWFNGSFPSVTLKATADRPFTFFNYNGFNPEVSNGVDSQTYPIPAVYTLGATINFK